MSTTAKVIKVSSDDVTYYTLPGNSGEMTDEAGQLVDTIFGQSFESHEVGLINWKVSANALYKGFAGYVATIKKVGSSSTASAGESCTLVSGKTYQIDNAAHQIWDRTAAVTVYDNAVDHTADVASIDYLNGTVTFASAYTVTGPITVDISYFSATAIASGKTFSLTQTANAIDTSDLPTAQANSGHRTYESGLRTVALEIGGIFSVSNAFRTALIARSEVIIEIAPQGVLTGSYCRGFFKYSGRKQSGNVGALEEETVNFVLNVPDDQLLETPFKWIHPGTTTLNTAVQKAITGWQDQTDVYVQYLSDGTNGFKGSAVVTEVSLKGGLDAMNEFQCMFQATGAATALP